MDETLVLINQWIWSVPFLLLFLGTGAYLTYQIKGFQFRYIGSAFRELMTKTRDDSPGDISHFEALMTTLAGAIGTGSIVGVGTAISIGGTGALFWMWIATFFAMAIKYGESLLAVKYRKVDERGEMSGGPMQYMSEGLGWKKVAVFMAILGSIAAFGTGNIVQANSIAEAINYVWGFDPLLVGAATAVLTACVIIGGVQNIGYVAGMLVPFMAVFYVGAGLIILLFHFQEVPAAFVEIITSAYTGQAATGGLMGATVLMAMQVGMARSIFTNESGLGITAIAAAAAKTDVPARQAMITMVGALISTLVVSSITGLVLVVTGAFEAICPDGCVLEGASMTIRAFASVIPGGGYLVTIGLVLFAFSTMIAWGYYGEKCFEYLFGERYIILYRIFYALIVIPGAVLPVRTVWLLADSANGLMAIPNLIALIALGGVIASETAFFVKHKRKRA